MHATSAAAFADSPVGPWPSLEGLRRLMIRRGVCYASSVGAFAGERMVGVMMVGFDHGPDGATAYDIFTGVLPTHRGRGIAGALFEFARPGLVARGAARFQLEVLQTNAPALRAYRRAGFEVRRDLVCLSWSAARLRAGALAPPFEVRRVAGPDWAVWRGLWSWEPSWQNSPASVDRAIDEKLFLEARAGGSCVGCAVALPATGELPQIAVAPEHRRRGLGSRLFGASVGAMATGGPVSLVNIDASAHADLRFFAAHGAREILRQHEMTLAL